VRSENEGGTYCAGTGCAAAAEVPSLSSADIRNEKLTSQQPRQDWQGADSYRSPPPPPLDALHDLYYHSADSAPDEGSGYPELDQCGTPPDEVDDARYYDGGQTGEGDEHGGAEWEVEEERAEQEALDAELLAEHNGESRVCQRDAGP
jgi:hypothetical protein